MPVPRRIWPARTLAPVLAPRYPLSQDLDPLGVAGVFGETDVVQLIQILRDVQGRAAA
jgi:hypothetical protein